MNEITTIAIPATSLPIKPQGTFITQDPNSIFQDESPGEIIPYTNPVKQISFAEEWAPLKMSQIPYW